MKLDGATIAIERRSIGACVDLAVMFYGAHVQQMLGLTALVAVPACLLTYWLVHSAGAGLVTGLLLFYAGSPFLGAAIVAGAGHRVFGDPFTVMGTLGIIAPRSFKLFFALVVTRLGIALSSFLCIPLPIIAVRYGFLSEVLLLEQSRGMRFERRISDLLRGVSFDLLMRQLVLVGFYLCVFVSVYTLIDLVSGFVFSFPILFGRISTEFLFDDLWFHLTSDARVVTAICATLWLVYPLARLAWFFCYLDTRIRKEAWDVELDLRIEAQRLLEDQAAVA